LVGVEKVAEEGVYSVTSANYPHSLVHSLFDLLSCGVWAHGNRSASREAVFGAWEGNHCTHYLPLWLSLKVAWLARYLWILAEIVTKLKNKNNN